jgi:hypothetical protein
MVNQFIDQVWPVIRYWKARIMGMLLQVGDLKLISERGEQFPVGRRGEAIGVSEKNGLGHASASREP